MNRIMNMKNFFAPSAWRLGGASVRRAATALLVMMLTAMTAWAQQALTLGENHLNLPGVSGSTVAYDYTFTPPWQQRLGGGHSLLLRQILAQ